MELRQLRHFVALAEEMHFGLAAKKACITQPSLSASIARLEQSFGFRLFVRTSKRVRITPAGELMLRSAREMLAHEAQMQTFSKSLAGGTAGRLEIGFSQPLLCCGLDQVILDCRRALPEIDIVMRESVTQRQIELIRSGKLDAGVVMLPVPPVGMDHIELFEDMHVAWLPGGHRLAANRTVSVGMLRDEDFILPRHGNAPYLAEQVVGLCAAEGFYPRLSFEADSAVSALHMVARGLGVSYLARALDDLQIPGIVFAPLRQASPPRDVYFVWNAERVAPGLQTVIDGVRVLANSPAMKRRRKR